MTCPLGSSFDWEKVFFMFKGAALWAFFLEPFSYKCLFLVNHFHLPHMKLSYRSTWLVFGVGCMCLVCVAVLLKSPMFRNSAHEKSKGEVTSKPHTAVTSAKQEPQGWTDMVCQWEWALMINFLSVSLFSLQETLTETSSFVLPCRKQSSSPGGAKPWKKYWSWKFTETDSERFSRN